LALGSVSPDRFPPPVNGNAEPSSTDSPHNLNKLEALQRQLPLPRINARRSRCAPGAASDPSEVLRRSSHGPWHSTGPPEREDGSWDSLVAYLLRLPRAEEHVDSVPLFQISVTTCRNKILCFSYRRITVSCNWLEHSKKIYVLTIFNYCN
jgi:hypothetical protein